MGQYTLIFDEIFCDEDADKVVEQTLTNTTTNEQFSVKKEEEEENDELFTVTIKRGMKTKKN